MDVTLLGVRVSACVVIDAVEHRRRRASGLCAVADPALLDLLAAVPANVPVIDPVLWASAASQPPGVVERGEDGGRVIRRLESPLRLPDVVVRAAAGRELRAVQDASLFAGFARRWVAAGRCVPEAAMLEAKLCGVGILGPGHRVLLGAENPAGLTRDGWSWLLEEKAYRCWLSGRARLDGTARPGPATDGASVPGAG